MLARFGFIRVHIEQVLILNTRVADIYSPPGHKVGQVSRVKDEKHRPAGDVVVLKGDNPVKLGLYQTWGRLLSVGR